MTLTSIPRFELLFILPAFGIPLAVVQHPALLTGLCVSTATATATATTACGHRHYSTCVEPCKSTLLGRRRRRTLLVWLYALMLYSELHPIASHLEEVAPTMVFLSLGLVHVNLVTWSIWHGLPLEGDSGPGL
jgi:hypothetical protein